MKFSSAVIAILIFTIVISMYNDSMAFVSKPVDKIPGVKFPTPNPDVPTLAPKPTVQSNRTQLTPLYIITTPTANPTPIFQEIKEEGSDTKDNKQGSSTLKIILFLMGSVLIGGGLIFFYKTKG